MFDLAKVTQLYDEAKNLHVQATAIMDEFKGKDMPAEKSQEVDRLLDEVEAKSAKAKAMESVGKREQRASEQGRFLNDPVTRKSFFNDREGKGDEETTTPEKKAYAKAMRSYLMKGVQGLTQDEVKALSTGTPSEGGYLVTDTFFNELLKNSRELTAMRRMGRTLPPVPSGSVITPTASPLSDAEWTTEIGAPNADTVKPFGGRKLTPHPFRKLVLVSNAQLRNPNFDVEAWLREEMAFRFSVTEENGFINGDGNQKPLGLLNTVGLPTWTTASSLVVHGDDVINWVYKLPALYSQNAKILCNRSFIRKIRTLATKNATVTFTNYIWQPGLAVGQPNTILDVPYEFSDKFSTGLDGSDAFTANSLVAVVGDYRFFWIVDALGMAIQRLVEKYADTDQVGFIGRKESDGIVVLPEAFYALKIKA